MEPKPTASLPSLDSTRTFTFNSVTRSTIEARNFTGARYIKSSDEMQLLLF